jgi:putative hydrolase of the HAD superfamily
MAARQHLIFDADDTLWENNIYFERAFDEFVEFLGHSTLAPAEVRNVRQCYERLAEREISEADLDRVMSFAERILEQPLVLIDGVRETIKELAERHDLILFTKGHPDEQKFKIEASGLAPYFRHTAIVREKAPDSYRSLVGECALPLDRAWMIGNSPRSDINPALEIGLGAVYIPHPRTWSLEAGEIPAARARLLVLDKFPDLRQHF